MRGSGVRIPLAAPPSGFSLPRRKPPTVGGLDASILIDAGFVTAGIRLADAVERMPVPHETDPPSDERALGELAAVPANAKAPLADPASLAGLPPGDDLVRDPRARSEGAGVEAWAWTGMRAKEPDSRIVDEGGPGAARIAQARSAGLGQGRLPAGCADVVADGCRSGRYSVASPLRPDRIGVGRL